MESRQVTGDGKFGGPLAGTGEDASFYFCQTLRPSCALSRIDGEDIEDGLEYVRSLCQASMNQWAHRIHRRLRLILRSMSWGLLGGAFYFNNKNVTFKCTLCRFEVDAWSAHAKLYLFSRGERSEPTLQAISIEEALALLVTFHTAFRAA